MPISPIVLQRRHAELGRIRLGEKRTSKNGKQYPTKLQSFRFTSPSERHIRDLAELYGGTPEPWDSNGKPEWQVTTAAVSLPVIVVKNGVSQWMETWSGGGIVHRCDGETGVDGTPCDPDDPAHQQAKPTTRLSVMLPELEAVGVFRLESHGWNAAAEIPAVAELAQFVGDLVPARLYLMERRIVRDGETSRFVVPVLDLQIGKSQLQQLVQSRYGPVAAPLPGAEGPAGVSAPAERPALPSGQQAPAPATPAAASPAEPDLSLYYKALEMAETPAHVMEVFDQAKADSVLGPGVPKSHPLYVAIQQRGKELLAAQEAPQTATEVWQLVLVDAGDLGWSLSQVNADFEARMGIPPALAAAGEMRAYLELLRKGVDEQPAGAVS